LVVKKDRNKRVVVDYRKLNELTEKEKFPLQRVEDMLESLQGNCVFSTLDLCAGYWQNKATERASKYSAFTGPHGHYEPKVLFMGLTNAVAVFQRNMSRVLEGTLGKFVDLHVDDIIIYSSSVEEHLVHLEEVLKRLMKYNVIVKFKKAEIGRSKLNLLGHVIDQDGISMQEDKMKAMIECSFPSSVKDVRSFLGLTGYYRRFIKDYAKISKPLVLMTKKNGRVRKTEEAMKAFETLKESIRKNVILLFPDFNKQFKITTDASLYAIGGVLEQQDENGLWRPVRFGSKILSATQESWGATERECYALVKFLEEWRHYIEGREDTIVETDCSALTWLFNKQEPKKRFLKWILSIQDMYPLRVVHKAGKKIPHADALSRMPYPSSEEGIRLERGRSNPFVGAGNRETEEENNTENSKEQKEINVGNLKELESDPEFEIIVDILKNKDLKRFSEERIKGAKRIVEQFVIEDNELLRLYWPQRGKKETRYQWVVPKEKREEIMHLYHDSLVGGHFGVKKTYARMVQKYWWPRMFTEVQGYVKNCNVCELARGDSDARAEEMQVIEVKRRGQQLNIDLVELDRSRSGNKFILVGVWRTRRFPFAIPIPDKKATTVARALFDNILSLFGLPEELTSDQGKEFVNSVLEELKKYLRMEHKLSTPYHPQTNGLVERFNRTLKEGLRKYCSANKQDWDLYLQHFMFAYRAAMQDSIGMSPFKMTFGYEPRMPGEKDYNEDSGSYSEWIENMQKNLKFALEHIKEATKKNKMQYDKRNKNKMRKFRIGEFVKIKNRYDHEGASKLKLKWRGPYQVVEEKSAGVYRVKRPEENDELAITINATNMGEWKSDVAIVEDDQYEIEMIMGHRQDEAGNMEYRVRWKGWTKRHDSWKKEEDMNAEELLKEYWRLLEFEKSEDDLNNENKEKHLKNGNKEKALNNEDKKNRGKRIAKRKEQRKLRRRNAKETPPVTTTEDEEPARYSKRGRLLKKKRRVYEE